MAGYFSTLLLNKVAFLSIFFEKQGVRIRLDGVVVVTPADTKDPPRNWGLSSRRVIIIVGSYRQMLCMDKLH